MTVPWGVLGLFPSEPLPRGSFCLETLSICREIQRAKEMVFVAEAVSVSAMHSSSSVPSPWRRDPLQQQQEDEYQWSLEQQRLGGEQTQLLCLGME